MNDKWSNFEGLDRCSNAIFMVEGLFLHGEHPSLDTYEKRKLYRAAVENLAMLYQKIGEREFEE